MVRLVANAEQASQAVLFVQRSHSVPLALNARVPTPKILYRVSVTCLTKR